MGAVEVAQPKAMTITTATGLKAKDAKGAVEVAHSLCVKKHPDKFLDVV